MTTTRSPQIGLGERTVGEVMRLGVVTCAPDTPLSEVARLMGAYRIHCVVVSGLTEDVHGTRLVWGVVSDLDLARALASDEEATAGQVAATEPVTASPYDTLADVAQVMAEHEIAHLVVIDGVDAEPMGMISTLDLARAYAGAV
jgi:CBS domain-containing protein